MLKFVLGGDGVNLDAVEFTVSLYAQRCDWLLYTSQLTAVCGLWLDTAVVFAIGTPVSGEVAFKDLEC